MERAKEKEFGEDDERQRQTSQKVTELGRVCGLGRKFKLLHPTVTLWKPIAVQKKIRIKLNNKNVDTKLQ